jgi:glycosidase
VVAPGPWSGGVVYEAFVRSFSDSDGDGIGDFAGMTAKLDYLNDGDPATHDDLGVSAIWLMPVAEATSYHGYDVVDYDTVEKDYGTEGQFKALVAAAHARGIKVIVDFEINHTSIDHPWFQDALKGGPHHDWYVWSKADPGWPPVAGPNPWHKAGDAYYYGAFSEGMPDLNLRNPDVTKEIERIAAHWLTDFDVDGFRIDAAKHLIEDGADAQMDTPETRTWLSGFRDAVHAVRPDALVLGEVWDARVVSAAYTAAGSLDMAFDFGLATTLLDSVSLGDGPTLGVNQAEVATRYAPGLAGTFLSNHDQVRTMSRLTGGVDAARVAAEALLTGPGVPFVYYGEEVGLAGVKPDERLRTPFPWTADDPGHGFTTGTPWEPFAPGVDAANVAAETGDAASLLSTYRRLIDLRSEHRALGSEGAVTPVTASRIQIAATIRSFVGETLLVLQNLRADAVAGLTLDLGAGPLCGTPAAETIYASPGAVALAVTPPTVTTSGGFGGYAPVTELPGRTTLVVRLSSR